MANHRSVMDITFWLSNPHPKSDTNNALAINAKVHNISTLQVSTYISASLGEG